MILPGQEIRKRCLVMPCVKRQKLHGLSYGLSPAGYDIRVAQEIDLPPGGFMLGSSIEHFNMPTNVLGIVYDKSTLARMGLSVFNTVIEPGWFGYLTIELANKGPDRIRQPAGSPIAQVIFHLLLADAEQPYTGKYQGQQAMPVAAILEG